MPEASIKASHAKILKSVHDAALAFYHDAALAGTLTVVVQYLHQPA
jgi:hypothetical protein